MKRLRALPLTVAIVAAPVSAAPVSAAPVSAQAPRAVVRDLICQRALDPPARAVSITAVMRPLIGTQRMQLKFDLLRRAAGALAYTPLAGTGLGSWIAPPDPTLGQRPGDAWIVQHPVADLAAPATYRFRVSFRWLGERGQVLGSAVRSSRSCRQPELRPDLVIESFAGAPIAGSPGLSLYTLALANTGATAAHDVEIDLTGGRRAVITRLAAHSSWSQGFAAASCAVAAPPVATVDPQHLIDDVNGGPVTATARCAAG